MFETKQTKVASVLEYLEHYFRNKIFDESKKLPCVQNKGHVHLLTKTKLQNVCFTKLKLCHNCHNIWTININLYITSYAAQPLAKEGALIWHLNPSIKMIQIDLWLNDMIQYAYILLPFMTISKNKEFVKLKNLE